jgi:formylglycine-generating enzyme required for sulfatase activity
MKRKIFLTAMFSIVLAFGMMFVGCPMESKHEHDFSGAWEKDDTEHWKECADDGEKAQTELHTYGEWEIVEEATEDVAGSQRRECTECEYVDTAPIPQLEHTHDFSGAWEKDDTEHWKECAADGEKAQIIAHTYGEWETVTEATFETVGSKRRACTECEYVDTDVIPLLELEMVTIEGGLFDTGDNYGTHNVTLSSFSIGKYEVTQAEYEAVMGANPSYFDGDNLPVETVSWYDAIVFSNTLSMMEGLEPAYSKGGETNPELWGAVPTSSNSEWNVIVCDFDANGYRLPTEAEWEYAARGGVESAGYEYSGSDDPDEVAWYDENSGSTTHNVGTKAENELGLYDMSGNVFEWCWDWYGSYPSGNLEDDYTGVSSGTYRVVRGGSWGNGAVILRSSYRYRYNPYDRYGSIGFRLVRPVV